MMINLDNLDYQMNYMRLQKFDIANGDGIGTVLWVAGCTHKCLNCHNPQTWDFSAGKPFTTATMIELMESLDSEHVKRLTLSGGDPLNPRNVETVNAIVQTVRAWYKNSKRIWIYTGYLYEEVSPYDAVQNADVLVDGEFIQDKKDISLKWRGSSNQRVIDIRETKKSGEVILLNT